MMDPGLRGRVALVTGASGAIGSEIVRMLAAEGARVVVHYHTRYEAAVRLIPSGVPEHALISADLTSENDVARLWTDAEQQVGPIEIVIANAGIWEAADVPIHQMSLQQWNHTLQTDLTSVFLCMREFFRSIERHGVDEPAGVLVGSTAGVLGEAGHADYAAAKGGLVHGFLLSLKNEIARLAPRGRMNAVCPGWTVSPMTQQFMERPEIVRRALQTVPLRKVGWAADVATAVLFLASSRLAGHVSGQVLMVSGGMEGRVLYERDEIDPSRVAGATLPGSCVRPLLEESNRCEKQ